MKVSTFLPVIASAKFYLNIDEEKWNKMNIGEKTMYFINNCHASGIICNSCANNLNCDLDIDCLALEADPFDLEFTENK